MGGENSDGNEAGRNAPTEGQALEEGDPMAKLLQQVNEMEEERENLKQKLEAVEKEKEELNLTVSKQKGKKSRFGGLYFGLILVFAMLAACLYNALEF